MYVNSYIISTLSGSKVEAVKQLVREIELVQVASSLTIPSPRIRGSHGTVVNPNFHSTNSPLDPPRCFLCRRSEPCTCWKTMASIGQTSGTVVEALYKEQQPSATSYVASGYHGCCFGAYKSFDSGFICTYTAMAAARSSRVLQVALLVLVVGLAMSGQAASRRILEQRGGDEIIGFVGDFLLGEIKIGRPSYGGRGHKMTTDFNTEEVKDSGPSPGIGH